jgi:hypothetical protein
VIGDFISCVAEAKLLQSTPIYEQDFEASFSASLPLSGGAKQICNQFVYNNRDFGGGLSCSADAYQPFVPRFDHAAKGQSVSAW